MAEKQKFRGVETDQEISSQKMRPDTRTLTIKARDFFNTTDGVVATAFVCPVLAALLVYVPMSGELLVLFMAMFYQLFVNPGHNNPKKKGGKYKRYDFPYRVPFFAKLFDGSVPGRKLGEGLSFLGKEISTNLEIWSGQTDLRTHMLVLGTTGSGKTEFLLGLVYNALVQNSGFIYTDGKGDVSLFNNVFRLARYLGREDDLLVINFLTSGRDFLDRQVDRTTNTMNPFALGSSGMLIELIISLMDDSGGGGDMWKGRAIAFVAGLTRALCFLRDRGYLLLDANKFIQYFELPVVEKMVWKKIITEGEKDITVDDPLFDKVLEPLKAFILTLPGYAREKIGNQEQKTVEQHGFITMQLTRLFGDMSFTYGYLFQTSLGEVDMYDVVINRRILVCLLPALERAPDSLKMLGKLIVGAIKQMMAGCLGNRLEGAVREIVDARPTNAKVPFYVVLDEYGYYAVLGFAVAPAQARSLGFPQPESSLVRMADGSHKTMGQMEEGDVVALPDGRSAAVTQVLEQGVLPVSRVVLADGKHIDAANVHHWPARIHGYQTKLMTTVDMLEKLQDKVQVELSRVVDGKLEWVNVEKIEWLGILKTRCLVVNDELHCYLTDHDVVTHNCIIFAAQDFSSLQKASKEEADATWENTNVRALGRTTGGRDSETFRRFAGVAGEAKVNEVSRKEFNAGAVMDGYVSNRDTQVGTAARLEYDDVASQENGEFTFVIGKKNKDGSGSVRVVRGRGFYTAVDKERTPRHLRVNHFIKIEPPRAGNDDDDAEIIERLEEGLLALVSSGKIKELFPNDPEHMIRNKQPSDLLKMRHYLRLAQERDHVTLRDAVRVALVCSDAAASIQEASTNRQIAERKRAEAAMNSDLAQSVAVVDQEPVTVITSEVQAEAEDSDTMPMSVSIEQASDVARPGGMESVAVEMDDLPMSIVLTDDEGESDSGSSSAGGESGGPMLIPMMEEPESTETGSVAVVESAAATHVDEAAIILSGYLSGLTFEEEPVTESQGETGSTARTPERFSLLTLRPMGEDSDTVPESTDRSIYLEENVAKIDIALGEKTDLLEIKEDARDAVREMERATTYVNGSTPEPATLPGLDEQIGALLQVAESNSPDFG